MRVHWLRLRATLEDQFSPSRTSLGILLIFPFAIWVIYASIPPKSPLLVPDSAAYMYFDPIRPIGYPIFLYVIKHITGNYESLRYLQLVVFCLCVYVAAISLSRYFEQLFLPILFEAGVLGHPGLVRLTDVIASDWISVCAFLLLIAAVFHFGRSPSMRRYGLVCVVLAAALTLRPINIAMVPPVLLLPLFFRQQPGLRPIQCITIGLVSAVAGWGATPVANTLLHGRSETSYLVAVDLFTRTVYLEPGREPRPNECEADFIEDITVPVVDYLKGVPSEFYGIFLWQYTSYVPFYSIVPGLVERHNLGSDSQTYPILMCYTLARYRHAPAAILWDIAANYWRLLSNYIFIDEDTRSRLLTFLQAHPPVLIPTFPFSPHEQMQHRAAIAEVGAAGDHTFAPWHFEAPRARPLVLILSLKIAQLSAWAISLVLVITLLPAALGMIRRNEMIVLGLISLAVQLDLLIAAVGDIAEPRHVFAVWPGLWLALIWSLSKLLRVRAFTASPVGT